MRRAQGGLKEMRRSLLAFGLCASALLAPPSHGTARAAVSRFNVALSDPRVSFLDGNRVAVSFLASGDIRGLVSFTMDTTGTPLGDWALVSRYHLDLPNVGVPGEEGGEGARHPGHERELFEIHERGSLSGRVTGGALRFGPDGQLAGIDSLTLTISSGSIEFDGLRGSGSATVDLADTNARGRLTLEAEGR
jgi:hypothetical protein